ncbi:hypothetical protein KDJ56_12450 [Brevibacillus composti]|uniref:Uncharacterized protein n=1 Tax=Brevibacillus composti TaxID=2796470 RepID=A0A7T5EHQ3_9BACL|nr:hypothetical protein [Brevibacillus composti]QQE72770.1 hypothetical protein JD108_12505 [Brevibacillus composti]QUO39848.1 hypothetical protein KDJ56_12450 [Brevibacillus composti]
MTTKKWRNPYAPMPSRKLSEQPAEVSLAVTPKKAVQTVDLRTSVSRMRSNIKGISSTIRQVEETMDTLYGAMEIFDSIGKRNGKNSEPEKPPADKRKARTQAAESADVEELSEGAENSGGNPLGNLDIGQLLGILQSPLVQNLLSQTTSGASKRKKEG